MTQISSRVVKVCSAHKGLSKDKFNFQVISLVMQGTSAQNFLRGKQTDHNNVPVPTMYIVNTYTVLIQKQHTHVQNLYRERHTGR